MDPYDGILEQLKRAQEQAEQSVASRLTSVLNSLETALGDARGLVDAGAGGAGQLFPVDAVEHAVEDARRRLDAVEERAGRLVTRIEELEVQLSEAQAQPPAPAGLSLEMLRRLDRARSQSELLRELLPVLAAESGRAAVLVAREGTISAWSGVGLGGEERLRSWQAPVSESPALQAVIEDGRAVRLRPSADPVLGRWLEDEGDGRAVVVPVSLRGRVVGAIYVDGGQGADVDGDTVQSVVAVACWLIDTLGLRQAVPSPMLAEVEELDVPAPAALDDRADGAEPTPASGVPRLDDYQRDTGFAAGGAEPEPEPEPEPAPHAAAPAGEYGEQEYGEQEFGVEPEELTTAEPEEEPPEEEPTAQIVETSVVDAGEEIEVGGYELDTGDDDTAVHFDPSTTVRLQTSRFDVGAEPAPEPVEEMPTTGVEGEAEAAADPAEVVPPPVRPVTPPPPAPAAAPVDTGRSPEEQAQHEEARRFARLLVSEIKLYNEDEVELGRRNADLYPRLKEDIDRSREMYDKRISERVRSDRDYFREELVRILADGDADALGM